MLLCWERTSGGQGQKQENYWKCWCSKWDTVAPWIRWHQGNGEKWSNAAYILWQDLLRGLMLDVWRVFKIRATFTAGASVRLELPLAKMEMTARWTAFRDQLGAQFCHPKCDMTNRYPSVRCQVHRWIYRRTKWSGLEIRVRHKREVVQMCLFRKSNTKVDYREHNLALKI